MDRIKIFQVIVFIIVTALIARLFYWQFIAKVESSLLSDIPENILPAPRGEIYAADGFPLVTNQQSFLIYGKPRQLQEKPQNIAKILAPHLISEKYATQEALLDEEKEQKAAEIKKTEEDLAQKLQNQNLFWVQLARKIPLEVKEKIESKKIEGLGFERDDKRFYPEASLAAHVLGFVGSDKFGQDTGYFGLEGYYDRILKGKPGRLGSQIDPFGFPILVGPYRSIETQKGASLYTSINRSIQFMAEEKLKASVEKYGAKNGTVIVSDPKNGQILAMASYPAYSPAFFTDFDQSLYKNPTVADTYEPGSTFKLIAMSAALDLGKITPNTKCDICSGPRHIGGFEISTWNKKYYPDSNMIEVIIHSDNIGMTYVADKLGVDKFYEYITKFGLGKPTGIDLQEESTGFIRSKEEWKPIDLATASFGQGLTVNPIQMIQAVAAIANSGKLISPHVVNQIKDGDLLKEIKPEERQVILPKTASTITEMMVAAVEKGEARAFAPKNFRIAGKTGTAQIPVAGHYDPEKTIATFVGFAPADDPKFVMLVKFTEPSSSPFGSETAAPTFFEIAEELFTYFAIPPSK